MTTFYVNDLVEQWKQHKIKQQVGAKRERSAASDRDRDRDRDRDLDRNHIFNKEFKSRLLANSAKDSLLARKILIEMYVDKLNKYG